MFGGAAFFLRYKVERPSLKTQRLLTLKFRDIGARFPANILIVEGKCQTPNAKRQTPNAKCQTPNAKRQTALIIGLFSLFGCDDSSIDHNLSKEQELVVNTRDVETVRSTLNLAVLDQTDSHQQQAMYFRAHAANSSGHINNPLPVSPQDPRLHDWGSGTLTGAARLTGAAHTAFGNSRFLVLFGGSNRLTSRIIPTAGGGWSNDVTNVTLPFGETHGGTGPHRRSVDEENPLLAQRLFAMSLNAWADDDGGARAIRSALRSYYFTTVQGNIPQTYQQQGFLALNGNTWNGQDIVVMEPTNIMPGRVYEGQSRPEVIFDTIPQREGGGIDSGEFNLMKPGVFFDYVTPSDYHPLRTDGTMPLTSVYYNRMGLPDILPPTQDPPPYEVSPLAALSGYWISDSNQNQINGDIYTDLIYTTIDAIRGSSGGALLVPDLVEYYPDNFDRFFIRPMFFVGVLHSTNGANDWDQPAVIDSEPNPMGTAHVSFTAVLGQDPPILTGLPPQPVFGGDDRVPCVNFENDESCIECATWGLSGECERTVWRPASGNGNYPYLGIKEDDPSSSKPGERARAVVCRFRPDGSQAEGTGGAARPGAMIGFIGGTTRDDAAVGSLLSVCAPLSSESYVENWEFLALKGGRTSFGLDTVAGRLGWTTLNLAMSYAYELRKDEAMTPAPMKVCPPNYLLHGFTFSRNSDGNVEALVSLNCMLPDKTRAYGVSDRSNREEYLSATTAGVGEERFNGSSFSLDVNIGDQKKTPTRLVRMTCDTSNHPIVVGIETVHKPDGSLSHLYALCGEQP